MPKEDICVEREPASAAVTNVLWCYLFFEKKPICTSITVAVRQMTGRRCCCCSGSRATKPEPVAKSMDRPGRSSGRSERYGYGNRDGNQRQIAIRLNPRCENTTRQNMSSIIHQVYCAQPHTRLPQTVNFCNISSLHNISRDNILFHY